MNNGNAAAAVDFGAQVFNFTQKKNGYVNDEVNALLIELYKQNKQLNEQNMLLANALDLCNKKILQLGESTEELEEARSRESVRIANVMITASKNADDMVAQATRRAEEILSAAAIEAQKRLAEAESGAEKIREQINADIAAVCENMNRMMLILQTAYDRSNYYFSELNAAVSAAYREVSFQALDTTAS